MNLFFYYFFLFFIYCIIGWCVETIYVAINTKKFVDRGFLIGPYCPIYGFSCLGIVLYLTQYKDNFVTIFILGVVICSIFEYFTSYIMEKLFKTRWWDYSHKKFNLNGRICGFNSLLFGVGSLLVIYIIQPFLDLFLLRLNNKVFLGLNVICLILFIVDTIISFSVANKFKHTITNLDVKKDSTLEFTKLVRETIQNNNKIFQKRLLLAFPNIDLEKLIILKNELEDDIKELLNK